MSRSEYCTISLTRKLPSNAKSTTPAKPSQPTVETSSNDSAGPTTVSKIGIAPHDLYVEVDVLVLELTVVDDAVLTVDELTSVLVSLPVREIS